GSKLESRHRYYWKVRVWDERGQLSESTETSWWEMGFLTPDDWKAPWISWKNPEADADRAGIRWIWIAGQDALKVEPNTSAVFRELVNIPEKPREGALFIGLQRKQPARTKGKKILKKAGVAVFHPEGVYVLVWGG